MKKFEEQLRQFAKLAIQTGVNLQKGQGLLLVARLNLYVLLEW